MAFRREEYKIPFRKFVLFMEKNAFKKEVVTTDIDGNPNYMHQIFDIAESILNNSSQNMLVNLPPRVGKSRYLGIYLIAYAMGVNPRCNFIYIHNNESLAKEQATTLRVILKHPLYQNLFDLELALKGWSQIKTTKGGSIRTCSIQSGITGFGAGLSSMDEFGGAIIFDEPHLARDAAMESSLMDVTDIFMKEVITRRTSRTVPFIVIGHRVSTNDIFGHLIRMKSFNWTHIKIPAIDPATGNSIRDGAYTIQTLREIEKNDNTLFMSQYMQEPVHGADSLFTYSKIKILTKEDISRMLPMQDGEDIAIAIDPNGSSLTSRDETAIVVCRFFYFAGDNTQTFPYFEILEANSVKYTDFEKIKNGLISAINRYGNRIKKVFIERHTHGTALEEAIKTLTIPITAGGCSALDLTANKIVPTFRKTAKRVFMKLQVNHLHTRGYLSMDHNTGKYRQMEREMAELSEYELHTKDDICDALAEIINQIYTVPCTKFINPNRGMGIGSPVRMGFNRLF